MIEHPSQPNDCSDSNLYAYRHSYASRYEEPEEQLEPGSPEALNKELEDYWRQESEQTIEEGHRRSRLPEGY